MNGVFIGYALVYSCLHRAFLFQWTFIVQCTMYQINTSMCRGQSLVGVDFIKVGVMSEKPNKGVSIVTFFFLLFSLHVSFEMILFAVCRTLLLSCGIAFVSDEVFLSTIYCMDRIFSHLSSYDLRGYIFLIFFILL